MVFSIILHTIAALVAVLAVLSMFLCGLIVLFDPLELEDGGCGYSISLAESGTHSMEPTFTEGETVKAERIYDADDVAIGDAVSYKPPVSGGYYKRKRLFHRVVGRHGDYYLLKGDNSPAPDPFLVTKDDIRLRSVEDRDAEFDEWSLHSVDEYKECGSFHRATFVTDGEGRKVRYYH